MAPDPRALGADPAPDGAPPGTAGKAPAAHEFNADARAAQRESADVTIGDVVYHRRRKNWEVTRELRRLLRVQASAGREQARIEKRIEALPADAADEQISELEDQIDAAGDRSDEAAFDLIAFLLRDADGNSPTVDHLKAHLDVEEAGALAGNLAGGGEPDPTPGTPS